MRYYIFKDGTMEASTATREKAIELIRSYQEQETHYLLKASFSIIAGEEEFIPYPTKNPSRRGRKAARH